MKIVDIRKPVYIHGSEMVQGRVYRNADSGIVVLACSEGRAVYLGDGRLSAGAILSNLTNYPRWELVNAELHIL